MTEYRLFEFDVPAGASVDVDDGEPILEERWLACQHPERPDDGKVAYHFDCPKCLLVVQTLSASGLWPETSIDIEKALAYCGPGGGDFWSANVPDIPEGWIPCIPPPCPDVEPVQIEVILIHCPDCGVIPASCHSIFVEEDHDLIWTCPTHGIVDLDRLRS